MKTFVEEVPTIISNNEEQILNIIKQDPFISQQDIANQLDLPRSTVATLISNLVNKNIIKGRAYVINPEHDIICIGAMNVDRKYVVQGDIMPQTSNPVDSSLSVGGVGRNIAENLGRLGEKVSLLSVAGFDHDFDWIKEQSQSFVNMEDVTQLKDFATGAYSAILDQDGEMQLALADMSIYDEMDVDWIKEQEASLSQASRIIMDLNPPAETVDYVIQFARTKEIKLTIVPVSSPKMKRLPKDLNGVDTIIVNLDESQTFFQAPADLETGELVKLWLDTGVNQVILTSGSQKTYYANQEGVFEAYQPPQVDHVVDVTGAGDSFVGGFSFGQAQGLDYETSIQLAMTNSYHTIQSDQTVRLNLSASKIVEEKNKLFH